MWMLIAFLLSRPLIANWLIERARKTPYTHITGPDGSIYMERYWLFNSYQQGPDKQERSKYPWFPWNIRLHWIRRADEGPHMHDHPWNARTFILRGGYVEVREFGSAVYDEDGRKISGGTKVFTRPTGSTAFIGYNLYHMITQVTPGGAWTLFISGPYKGTWGFLVDGVKIKWRTYREMRK